MNERTRSRPSRADRPARTLGRYVRLDALAIVIAIAAVLIVGIFLLDGPARVKHLTVDNPTDYDVSIQLASSPDGAWLPFAVLGLHATREFHDVVDQGDTWVFRFRAQGQDAGDLTISRDDLAAAGWQVTVPANVTTQLQQLGVPTSPCVSTDCQGRSG
jgi:hypothetical protein